MDPEQTEKMTNWEKLKAVWFAPFFLWLSTPLRYLKEQREIALMHEDYMRAMKLFALQMLLTFSFSMGVFYYGFGFASYLIFLAPRGEHSWLLILSILVVIFTVLLGMWPWRHGIGEILFPSDHVSTDS